MLALAIALAAAWWDERERRVPNLLNLIGLGLGLAMHGFAGAVAALLAFGFFGGIWLGVWGRGWRIGPGDVKLAAALAACLGPAPTVFATIYVIVLAARSTSIRAAGATIALQAVALEEIARCL